MSSSNQIKAILFDLDGTLLDTERYVKKSLLWKSVNATTKC
jgi:beta-phosphoglucomutase-like phosphatase (HAD superfamily)